MTPLFDPYTRLKQFSRSGEQYKKPHFRATFYIAPRVGIEPTTNRLHLSSNYLGGWTISSSYSIWNLEARRFECKIYILLPYGIVSTPSPKFGAWLGIAHDLFVRHLGSPEFTSFTIYFSVESCVMPDSTSL